MTILDEFLRECWYFPGNSRDGWMWVSLSFRRGAGVGVFYGGWGPGGFTRLSPVFFTVSVDFGLDGARS
jgi:hypothetical protein